ncbi:hypothetical protein [Moorena sp. SIO4A1]|uniref:hypothetical protein n=1 Tax=Moorena sp. SIO4A1 TaxID=2607835 RepID=UPI0025E40789|nr:hypothetical protein [Moorena sp. SIO4A1]
MPTLALEAENEGEPVPNAPYGTVYNSKLTMDILYDHQMFAIQKFGGISRIFIELMRELSPNSECSIHWHSPDPTLVNLRSWLGRKLPIDWVCRKLSITIYGITYSFFLFVLIYVYLGKNPE